MSLARLLPLCLLLNSPALADPNPTGTFEQATLPSLNARREAASAEIKAADAYFAGQGDWERAFPSLVDAPLNDPDFLRLRSEALRLRAVSRAAERVAPEPAGLSAAESRRYRESLAATCGLEDAADAAEGRFIAGLSAGLDRAPGLTAASVDPRLAALAEASRLPESPDADTLALALVQQSEAEALRATRRAALQAMTRPGDDALNALIRAALGQRSEGPESPAARARLQGLQDRLLRVEPLLEPELQVAARQRIADADEALYRAELSALVTAAAEPRSPRAISQIESDLSTAQVRLARRQSELDRAESDPAHSPLSLELARARQAAAAAQIAALNSELESARALSASGVEVGVETQSVDEADRMAEQARGKVEDARTSAEADLRAAAAKARETIADEVRQESERRAAALTEIAARRTEMDACLSDLSDALALASLDPDRSGRIDAAYLALRDLATRLHDASDVKAQRVNTLASRPDQVPEPEVSVGASEARLARDAALADLHAVHDEMLRVAIEEQDATVGLMIEAKQARRLARDHASASARSRGQRAFIPELMTELREARLVAAVRVRTLLRSVRELPSTLTDLTALSSLVQSSARLFIAALLWWFVRRQIPGWTRSATEHFARADTRGTDRWALATRWCRDRLEPGDPRRLNGPLIALVAALADLLALYVVGDLLSDRMPILGLIVALWAAIVAWRARRPLLKLLLSTADDPRPVLREVSPEVYDQARRSLRWVLAWRLAVALLGVLWFDLLAADRVAQLVSGLGRWLGVLLALWLLQLWSAQIQAACAAAEPNALLRWASGGQGRARVLRSAVGLSTLMVLGVWNLSSEFVSSRARFRWVGAAMARRQLVNNSTSSAPPDPDTLARIAAYEVAAPPNLSAACARAVAAHAAWAKVHRRGLVAVIGDRGSGLDLLPGALATTLPPAKVIRVPKRITQPAEAVAWLAQAMGLSAQSAPELVDHLQRMSGGVVMVMDLHLLLLRSVGGFAGLRSILEIMQETSEELFWICAVRTPTWRYLEGTPGAVDLGLFREQIHLDDLRADELATWLLNPLEQAGLKASFGAVIGPGPRDPRAEARARVAWFRLIEDLSQGRPLVARDLWTASLRASSAPDTVEHAIPELPIIEVIEELDTEDLFVLTALAIHGELDLAALVEVLNRPPSALRAACRRLEAMGVLVGDERGDRYDLGALVHPQVLRVLRQRAFLRTA